MNWNQIYEDVKAYKIIYDKDMDNLLDELNVLSKNTIALQKTIVQPEVCKWDNKNSNNIYYTECNAMWYLDKEHIYKYTYCPCCGKKVRLVS